MKKQTIIALAFYFCLSFIYSQTLNWNTLDSTKHIITANTGWDYSVSFGVGYGYMLKTKLPVVLNTNFSLPAGNKVVDDFKTKLGAQILLLNTSSFKASVVLNGVYRMYDIRYVRLQNFGSDTKGIFGYYKSKWFVAAEVGFDKAIVTHFKHSNEFKENIYANVVDGWYEPATGGNFYYGLQTGYSFKKSDLTLNIGRILTQNFKTTPLIPYYLMLAFNYHLP